MREKREFFFEDGAYDTMTNGRESFGNYNENFNQEAFNEEDFQNSFAGNKYGNMRQDNFSSYEGENPNRNSREYRNVPPEYMYGQQQGRNNFDFRRDRFNNDPYSCHNDYVNYDFNNYSCNNYDYNNYGYNDWECNNYDYNNFDYDNCGCMNYDYGNYDNYGCMNYDYGNYNNGWGYPNYGYNYENDNSWWIIILLLFWFCGGWGFCFF